MQQAHATLKKGGKLGAGIFVRGKREAKPKVKIESTGNDPTPQRQRKSAFGFRKEVHVGGQVSHRERDFIEVYAAHLKDLTEAEWRASMLLISSYQIAERVHMVSSRAYTGAPYTGGETGRARMESLKQSDIDSAALFEAAFCELTRNTPRWWRILSNVILREPTNGRAAPMSPREVGQSLSAYRNDETATAAGVMATKLALIRWLEALQTALAMRAQRQIDRRALQATRAAA